MDGTPYRSAYNRNGAKLARGTPATLDEYGESVLASVKAKITALDPNGTAFKFAFISDLHRSENEVYAGNEIDDRYSMRLLSRLCDDVDLPAVLCGGDITNARDENASYFQENMADVVSDFDNLIPYTNIFATVGNHDKRYSTSRPLTTNAQLKTLWNTVQQNGNGVDLHYIDDTNFYIDFTKYNVRIIFINQYDDVDSNNSWYANENIESDNGIHTHGTTAWKVALPTTDKDKWLVGVVIHGADQSVPTNPYVRNFNYTDLSNTLAGYVTNGGKGVLGVFAGHYHSQQGISLSALSLSNPAIPVIHVGCAYATSSQIGTADAYCFSVFVVDTTTGVFHEIRVGRATHTIPFASYTLTQNGLFHNGTVSANSGYNTNMYCVYNGNHVRFDEAWRSYGYNFTNLPKEWGYAPTDFVTSDTDNALFSANAGDVIKTELIFSADTAVSPSYNLKIFSPQISEMVKGAITASATYVNEITLSENTNITAIGGYAYAQNPLSGVVDFEVNVYKNGVKLVRA